MTRGGAEIHIEELVLHDFPALDADGVGDALRQEIARLGPSIPGSRNVERLDAGTFSLPRADAGLLGTRIAASVARAVGSGTMRP